MSEQHPNPFEGTDAEITEMAEQVTHRILQDPEFLQLLAEASTPTDQCPWKSMQCLLARVRLAQRSGLNVAQFARMAAAVLDAVRVFDDAHEAFVRVAPPPKEKM